jgi:hypothetical protein
MKANRALAAGQGGKTSVSQSQPKPEDEAERRAAVRALAGYLTRGTALLDRCDILLKAEPGVAPILAAATVLSAGARVGKVLAQVALVESRRRTIVETVQAHKPTPDELLAQDIANAQANDGARAELERRLDHLLEASRAQLGRADGPAAP